jgi:hypoxanthine phosphoribosyltransferase
MQTQSLAPALDVLEKVLASAAVLLPAIWAVWTKARAKWGHVSWGSIIRATNSLCSKMTAVSYRPACIVCLGRAGAIAGAVLSERFGRPLVPIVVLAFDYVETEAQNTSPTRLIYRRLQFVDFGIIKENVSNVLLLGIDVVTGSTMEQALEQLQKRGVTCSATACLFWNPEARIRPTFFVAERSMRARYPWHITTFSERYGFGTSARSG